MHEGGAGLAHPPRGLDGGHLEAGGEERAGGVAVPGPDLDDARPGADGVQDPSGGEARGGAQAPCRRGVGARGPDLVDAHDDTVSENGSQ